MNIALFASGSGSNVKNIIEYFSKNQSVNVQLVVSNKPDAGALMHAKNAHINTRVFSHQELKNVDPVLESLNDSNIGMVILAGFLLKIPSDLISRFNGDIINVHPSLLPKFGGKGMYGNHVHKAVLAQGESETGITIHYVNEHYDEGKIIQQFSTSITEAETLDSLLLKIKALEKAHFPPTIEKAINEQLKIEREKENQ
tara:strand:+ start:715 stop:1311 length:597 start_codon:yes stop_codon:yes gene_type:complete